MGPNANSPGFKAIARPLPERPPSPREQPAQIAKCFPALTPVATPPENLAGHPGTSTAEPRAPRTARPSSHFGASTFFAARRFASPSVIRCARFLITECAVSDQSLYQT